MIKASYRKHLLQFTKPATTSRGVMSQHTVYYLKLEHQQQTGYGEIAPLPGLSIEFSDTFEAHLRHVVSLLNDGLPPDALQLHSYPSIQFGIETALKSLQGIHPFHLFDTPFSTGKSGLSINGLVWMDSIDAMYEAAVQKIESGFTCIKCKVGALDFDAECRLIERIRKLTNAFHLDIRLDANGAFKPDEALLQLKEFARFDIHSIEQPLRAGQTDEMAELVAKSPIPIALDEELIGVANPEALLKHIRPAYIILKPTLLGGFAASNEWIRIAQQLDIGWWATSALESNIGLNAIAQWCSSLSPNLPQGLGTGMLYTNNLASPLQVKADKLWYDIACAWPPSFFDNLPDA